MAKVQPNASKKNDSAKPTAAGKPEKVKKEKVALPVYPGVGSKDPNVYPFKVIPTDFVHGKFESLDKDDFVKRSMYYEYKAQQSEARAAEYRESAKTADTKGGTGKANRYAKMMTKAEDMRKELEEAGIDVDALLKATKAKIEAEAAAKAAAPAATADTK